MKYNYDAIIIGSGIGGLACATALAKKGYKVIIFEKLHQPGGYLNTFKRGDYWFEGSTHQTSGFNNKLYLANTIKNLGINLPVIKLKNSFESIIFDTNKKNMINRYLIKSGRHNAIKSFNKLFNNNKIEIKKIFKLCNDVAIESLNLRKSSKTNKFNKKNDKKYKNFLTYKDKSFYEMLNFISNDEIKFLLSQYCYYFMFSSPSTVSATTISNFIYQLILRAPLFIKGGTKTLVNECLRIIKENNSEIKYKSMIKNILINKNKAIGVKTLNGNEYYAKNIISNINAFTTYNELILAKDTFHESEDKSNILNYQPSISTFQVYLGLPIDLKEYGFKASTTFFSNTFDLDAADNGNLFDSESDNFCITNYTAMDTDFSPEGKSSILITERDNKFKYWSNMDNKKYKIEKEKKQNIILKKLKNITGLPVEKAEVCFSATPKTMHFYSGKIEGGVLGLEKKIGNNKFKNKTNIENLYLVGADTTNSGGITSTFDSGIIVANSIIKG